MVKNRKLHECDHCSRGYPNKKDLVKHMREAHPVKKEKKSPSCHNLVFCPLQGCSWKSKTGNFSYHMNVHHKRPVYFQKQEYLKDAKRVCILCPKAVMGYNSYSHHLKDIHDIKLPVKSSFDQAQISEEALERKKEFHEKLVKESHDTQVLKKALENAV